MSLRLWFFFPLFSASFPRKHAGHLQIPVLVASIPLQILVLVASIPPRPLQIPVLVASTHPYTYCLEKNLKLWGQRTQGDPFKLSLLIIYWSWQILDLTKYFFLEEGKWPSTTVGMPLENRSHWY